eukprot:gnl/Spiro4/3503_TR1719_c1_g1_i1.p1 gnl/Spiro4/3503_TR1719_c1_g1~~gnl/Spiro4/3503_TR1719_c1_g1_i1.p1  ORF type:complete len:217 (+),score=36.44 gnl/Spiro4/3503_TR1719_c1_g1_i1:40-690(+)
MLCRFSGACRTVSSGIFVSRFCAEASEAADEEKKVPVREFNPAPKVRIPTAATIAARQATIDAIKKKINELEGTLNPMVYETGERLDEFSRREDWTMEAQIRRDIRKLKANTDRARLEKQLSTAEKYAHPSFHMLRPYGQDPLPRNHLTAKLFLERIGKGCAEFAELECFNQPDPLQNWRKLMRIKSAEMKELGVPPKQRKHILKWVERYKQGCYV